MQTIFVIPQTDKSPVDQAYPIHLGISLFHSKGTNPDLSTTFASFRQRQILIVSNEKIWSLYGEAFSNTLRAHTQSNQILHHLIPDGEDHKTWEVLDSIYQVLLSNHFDRHCALFALGGGIVGDITGFAAATYLRGVDVVQIPTTLLAQVDSSVGGKTAVNHPLGKNMIGAFWQPRCVLIDPSCLESLPEKELSAGLAEILKHGLIADSVYFDRVVEQMPALFERNPQALVEVIQRSCEIKTAVVSRDEREQGVRAYLNLGHTFGHAIELGLGFGTWLHGEAVGCGLWMAAVLSQQMDLLSHEDVNRIKQAVAAAKLPTVPPQWSFEHWKSLFLHDKKIKSGELKFVVLDGIGKAQIQTVDDDDLKTALQLCQALST
jgi:3-dehydroquinate synthase